MADLLIAQRYAAALGAAIPDKGGLEPASQALLELSEVFATHHDLHSCLANPAIDVDARMQVLAEALRRMDAPRPVRSLASELLRRGRIALLPEIGEAFRKVVDERLDRLAATVTSAMPLSGTQELLLSERLAKFAGKAVRLRCDVDPELIGGVVARIGGQVIDGSLRTRLANIRNALIEEELSPFTEE